MDGSTPVIAVGQSKPPAKLGKSEKYLAGLLIVLGMALIVGTLAWLALSTKDGSLVSKHVHTSEPVGTTASGTKVTNENDYAETVIVFALTIGAVMTTSGAFFGRIREIKFGTGAVVLQAPEEETEKAKDKASAVAKEKAPAGKGDEAAALARTLVKPQMDLAYSTVPANARPGLADVVGTAAATTAIEALRERA